MSQNTMDSNKKSRLSFQTLGWFVALWMLVLSVWLYVYSIRHGGVPCWDGFERCSHASQIWYDIRHFDLFHLWKHTNNQVVWPPVHAWLTGFFFVLFGPSLATARLLSLAAYWGGGFLTFYWFSRRGTSASFLGGIAAWCLYSTAPIVVQQAVGIMSEGVGLFFTLLVLVCIPPQDDRRSPRWFWSGLLLGVFFLFKYNYAFLTYAGLLISRYFQADASIRKTLNKENLYLFGVPVLIMILWFIPEFKDKYENLIYFAVNNTDAHRPWGWSTLFYYPQVIPNAYFIIPWLSIACLALIFIAAPIGWRVSLRNPVLACCIVHFAAVALHPMKMERFQYITMGLFFILTGEAIQTLFDYGVPKTWRRAAAWSAIVLLALPTILHQTDYYRQELLAQENVYTAPIMALVDRTKEADRTALLVTHDNANPPSATYYLITKKDFLQRDIRKGVTRWNHIFLFKSLTDVLKISPEERLRQLQYSLYIDKSNKIAIVEPTRPETIGIFPRVFAGMQEYANIVPQLDNYQLDFEREFPRAQIRVRIYKNKQP